MPFGSHSLSVIVPENPFAQNKSLFQHCLCAMDVEKLMAWWPGTPHSPHRKSEKVKAIQRSLDWKRVAQIAAYLLQEEITDTPERIKEYFSHIYEPKKHEPGRQWPPKVKKVFGYERSVFPTFSNVLIHVNGAEIREININGGDNGQVATLQFDETNADLNFSVIDGQHRINGAFLAISILKERNKDARWEIPAEIFLNLDSPNRPPVHQAQIFIDVNFYQKKVDRSLVADLFPTARGARDSVDRKERAQDIGRKLMLEEGPLVGMIQIPGIKYGVKEVITLATLNGAIENVLEYLEDNDIISLEHQTEFLVQVLEGWAKAAGNFKTTKKREEEEGAENIAYQGRILVSVLTLVPALLSKIKSKRYKVISDNAAELITRELTHIARSAGLIKNNAFISKEEFAKKGYVGSGGIGRFRDTLWAAFDNNRRIYTANMDTISDWAEENRVRIFKK